MKIMFDIMNVMTNLEEHMDKLRNICNVSIWERNKINAVY